MTKATTTAVFLIRSFDSRAYLSYLWAEHTGPADARAMVVTAFSSCFVVHSFVMTVRVVQRVAARSIISALDKGHCHENHCR
jgi:hypothetical protein